MLNTGQFRFNVDIMKIPSDDAYMRRVVRRRMLRAIGIAAPLAVAVLFLVVMMTVINIS